ncbi:protein kinase [Streptomyces sp. NPDC006335]|uniref:serine/threonine-protein kinase n=1 Tax=Streptomyces sp. NPDC006335 TaxID=3156895 RepID=UPI0033A2D4DC
MVTGRYRLVESIGQGGMGRVWRAADEMLDRPVAVKEMRIDGLDAEDTRTRRERTLREARATARIDHPNVVRVYDVVDEGERLWIVMELVKGRSLERMTVEDGPLGPRETALLGLGLVRALRQVHARGVLHRDIKPGNVLVESGDRTGRRIVLTDFGIAAMQDAEALTMVGMLVGSPDYMAPERVSGRPQGPPSDIWSLGATLCAALGGRSPFSRDTTLATLHAVLYEEPELPATAGLLTDILTALLEKDPSIRPGLDEVESALRGVAFPAPTPTLRMEAGEERSAEAGTGVVAAGELSDPASVTPGGDGPVTADPPGASHDEEGDSSDSSDSSDTSTTSDPEPGSSAPWTRPESPTRVMRAVRDPRVPEPRTGPEPAVVEPSAAAPDLSGEDVAESGETASEESGAEAEEPSDAVPVRRGSVGVGGAESRGTSTYGTASADEDAEAVVREPVGDGDGGGPSGAEPLGPVAGGSDSSSAGSRSGAEAEEPSDAVPVRRGASAGAGGTGTDGVGAEAVAVQPGLSSPAGTSAPPRLRGASASTEAASDERSEVRSETPSGSSVGAALRAGATTASTPLASAPTQDSLAAGAPTEHFPMPDAPTRDTPTSAASAPTRVGPVPTPHHPGVSLVRGERAVPGQHSADTVSQGSGADTGAPAVAPRTRPAQDPDPAPVLGPHPHRMPPGELPGPVRPAAPHRGRRRTTLVAAGSVVAASAVVVAIILATTSGSPGDDKAGGSPTASASVSSSEPGASTPGTPSSTVEGTSRPRSLPPGAHEEAGGFAWATPTGWRRDVKTGAEVHYTSPDGKQELAAKSSLARGDLMETWRTSEQNAHQGQDYRKIRLEETTFRDHPAVVWEYTFTLGGVPWHAQLLGFNVGDKSYQINTWYQPDIETRALETYEKVKDSFTVL